MKKDVSVIRDSIGKIVALLTNQSITVTQRGTKAYVQYHSRTGAIQLVNIPYLPDDASEEFISAVQGFLDHEVGHVLYTDPAVVKKLRKESAKVKNLANAIEDVYIERKMANAFTGSTGNLNSVRRFYLDKVAKPKIDEALAAGDMNAAAGYACLVQFRAWGGQSVAENFLIDNPTYAKLTEPLAKKLGTTLIEKIKKAESSADCLNLARAMCKKLEEAPPPAPPSSEGGCEKDSGGSPTDKPGEDKGSSDETPSDEKPDDKKSEAEDKGSVRAETDDSGKKRDEKSESDIEDVPPEEGKESGTEGGERKDESDGSDTDTDTDTGDGDEKDEKSGSDKPRSDEGEKDEGEKEEKPEDGLSISDDGDSDGEGEEGGEGGSSEDGEGGDDVAEDTPELATKMGTDEAGMEHEEGFDPFDAERDFDEDMGRALTKAAISEVKDSSYHIFSTEWDRIEPAPMCYDPRSIGVMVDRTQHMIASIQKTLERAISAKDRKTWNPGQRRGRIAPGALFRTVVGDDRVFRKRYETHAKNTAVSLLVDCSGSMSLGGKINVAGMAAFALSSTLERLKVANEVIGFTTRSAPAMVSAMKAERIDGVDYARVESLYMPVFKSFSERLGVDAKSRIAHLTERPTWLRENVDGECLKIAANRLKQQRAERHVLIVLSDGSPACPGDYRKLSAHLKDTARSLEDFGVEVIAVGIMDASVRDFYDKKVVLNDLDELPTTLIAELSKVLLAP